MLTNSKEKTTDTEEKQEARWVLKNTLAVPVRSFIEEWSILFHINWITQHLCKLTLYPFLQVCPDIAHASV